MICNCNFTKSKTSNNKIKHGMKNSPEYKVWKGVKKRIKKGYNNLMISESWAESFIEFLKDMGSRNGLSIERIDNNKGYCKHNCIWADKRTQCLNRKNLPKRSNEALPVGVNRHTNKNTFYSQISINGKKKYLGSFKTIEEASFAFFEEYEIINGKRHKDDI